MTNNGYKPLLIESIKASSDIEQHRFIGFDGNHCTAGSKALGVSDVSTEKDQFTPVAIYGILLIEAGGTISAGDSISSDADGKAVKTTDSAIINGYSLDNATEGQEIRILI